MTTKTMREYHYPFLNLDGLFETAAELGTAVRDYLNKYDAIMASPASFQRGVEISKLHNELFKALVMWQIDMKRHQQSRGVDYEVEHAWQGRDGEGI